MNPFARCWRAILIWLDWLNGDAAYRAFCRRHHHGVDCGQSPPTRAEFFKAEQERRWSGIRRCC